MITIYPLGTHVTHLFTRLFLNTWVNLYCTQEFTKNSFVTVNVWILIINVFVFWFFACSLDELSERYRKWYFSSCNTSSWLMWECLIIRASKKKKEWMVPCQVNLLRANNYSKIGNTLQISFFIALTALTIMIMTFLWHKIATVNVSKILKVMWVHIHAVLLVTSTIQVC